VNGGEAQGLLFILGENSNQTKIMRTPLSKKLGRKIIETIFFHDNVCQRLRFYGSRGLIW